MRGARVFTIPPGAPFLDTLVGGILNGRLAGSVRLDHPFALADLTLYLPTRRAARAIREHFVARLDSPLLLPRIRTLGDIDEDDTLDDLPDPELPPAVPGMERQLVLTKLVLGWSGALVRATAELGDDELVVPASPADAARLAASVGRLIDQVGTSREAWAGLVAGLPADLARYWQITLEFLRIATEFWPAYLAESGRIDPGERRDRLIRAEAARLAHFGSPAPVIAAGSTGSVPATADLLAAIARLPNGAVVLPGLDQMLDPEGFAAIGPSEREPAGASHPQYGLKKLLVTLGVCREDVEPLGVALPQVSTRIRVVSEAMRPAATTERWSDTPVLLPLEAAEALRDVGIVEAANEREEALAIAIILRGSVERPNTIAALVTPDRGLARRVAAELLRWGIAVDDSGGRPLAITPPGVLARLTAEVALYGAAAEPLLALAKHPLTTLGLPPRAVRRAARALERAILRGPRLRPGLTPLRQTLERFAAERSNNSAERRFRPSEAARNLSGADWAAALHLVHGLDAAIGPLEALANATRPVHLAELVAAHQAALAALTRDESGDPSAASAGEAGEALARVFEDLSASAHAGPELLPRDYPGLFAALIERTSVRRRGGVDPRVHIWGALEARLQNVDTVILGGLNEGTWPGQTRLDPLLSRPMRAALDLEPPERRIGLAAHDFAQAMGHRRVWLSRAKRQDGEPRVASRWLQRLTAYAGDDLAAAMRGRGERILAHTRQLDAPMRLDRSERPRPSPPVQARPKSLSATRIETLIRDPYAIYAQYILKLRPFEELAKLPDAAERGTLIHGILEAVIRELPAGPFGSAAEERLLAIGQEAFARHADFPEIATLWWPRFQRIARWFVRTEAARQDVEKREVEGIGRLAVTPDFELTARADRLDRLKEGRVAVVDYKTGTPPTNDEVLSLSPQLPLEALIAQAGGFEGLAAAEVARLEYYHLSGRGEGGSVCARGTREASRSKPALTLAEALALTEQRLKSLAAHFAKPEAEYLSRKIPRRGREFAGDYDHLARVAEWSVADASAENGDTP